MRNNHEKDIKRMLIIAKQACRIYKKDLYCGITINNDLSYKQQDI